MSVDGDEKALPRLSAPAPRAPTIHAEPPNLAYNSLHPLTTRPTTRSMDANLGTEHATAFQGNGGSQATLLNLPARIRVQIYWYSGSLGHPPYRRFINLNNLGAPDRNHDRPRFINTYALLLTCKTIYSELSQLVYGSHHFFVRPDQHGSLGALRRLRPIALSSLHMLSIHINVSSCGLGNRCSGDTHPWRRACDRNQDKLERPLNLSNESDMKLVREWLCLWEGIIRPTLTQRDRLTINLVCDVANHETGFEVVRPFLTESVPALAGCSIRLSNQRDKGLQELASQAATTVTGMRRPRGNCSNQAASSPFRFLDLPTEIRQHILSYTDLVLPFREVEWNLHHGLYYRYKFTGRDRRSSPHLAHGSSAWTTETPRKGKTSYLACWEKSYPAGCFCKAHHAADCTLFQCSCWATPTSLFLVCREMRQDALQVFFTQNRFIVAPTGGLTWPGTDEPPDRLPISVFLNTIVPVEALRYIRYLEIVFPPFGVDEACAYCPADSPQWHDWMHTLDRAKEYLDLPKLTVSIHFADWRPDYSTEIAPEYREFMNKEAAFAILEQYRDITLPLKKLKELARFFVHLSDPTACVEDEPPEVPNLEEMEQDIESTVMGNDYNAVAAGKNDVKPSRWRDNDQKHDSLLNFDNW